MRQSTALLLQRSFYVVSLLLGVVVILYGARVWLVPLALAVLLAFILMPIVAWLERKRVPRALAVTGAALAALVIIGGFAYVITWEIGTLAAQLQAHRDEYKANIVAKLQPVIDALQSAQGIEDVSKPVPPTPTAQPKQPPLPTPVFVEPHGIAALSWLPSVVMPALEFGGQALLVVVLAMFILARRENLRDRLLGVLGQRNLAGATRAISDTADRVSRFLLLLVGTNAVLGIGVAIGLYLIGVPYAVLWGVLAGALRFIPYVGVWVAALLPIALSMALFPGWTTTLLVFGMFLVLELIIGTVMEPLVFGHGTGVSPLPLLVAAVFWSWLWGPAGLVLSTPLTVLLVVLGRHVPPLRFLEVLLAAEPALDKPSRYYQRLLARDLDEACAIVTAELRHQALDTLCDEVVLPAMVRARLDHDEDALSADEERAVLAGTRVLINSALCGEARPPADAANGDAGPPTVVLGCPAHGPADALAMRLLGLLLPLAGCELKLVAPRRLTTQVRALAKHQKPAIVCIGVVPPGGLAQVAHFCRRAHAAAAGVHVVVGRWGWADDTTIADQRLRAAGADAITGTLQETVEQVLSALGKKRAGEEAKAPAIAASAH
jgi:predicted PurR-regulated permease PerM